MDPKGSSPTDTETTQHLIDFIVSDYPFMSAESKMQSMQEVLPFARELMEQGGSRRLLKIYLLGSGLAVCGLVGGLVDAASFVFGEKDTISMETEEFAPAKAMEEQSVPVEPVAPAEPVLTAVEPDDTADVFEEEEMFAKAKQNPAITQRRRSRSFAS
ncbi:G0/G1 switch protein 2 [Sardina pilchardus]|uniref:G0/G1 switch protein 2 n=1 Tax=Sardina pilchardus TaxID=27697 RepID=UPI002E1161D2